MWKLNQKSTFFVPCKADCNLASALQGTYDSSQRIATSRQHRDNQKQADQGQTDPQSNKNPSKSVNTVFLFLFRYTRRFRTRLFVSADMNLFFHHLNSFFDSHLFNTCGTGGQFRSAAGADFGILHILKPTLFTFQNTHPFVLISSVQVL